MSGFIVAGVFTALAFFILLLKLDLKKLLYLEVPLDLAVTGILMVMFQGTFSGMMAAIIGGLVFSIVLFVCKRTIGYQRPRFRRFRFGWDSIPAKWTMPHA